jgi:hypothetical protein
LTYDCIITVRCQFDYSGATNERGMAGAVRVSGLV